MDTSVSLQSIVQGAVADSNNLTEQLATIQAQVATGQQYPNVSDDPSAALTVLANNNLATTYGNQLDNINAATATLNNSVSTLQAVSNIFTQAQSIALQASSSTNDASAFTTDASSVNALLNQLISLANTQDSNGTYLYSGTSTGTQPFVVTASDGQGEPTQVQYQGSANNTSMFVDSNQQVALDYAGSQVFQATQRQTPVFTGTTGAQPGTGTDTATAPSILTISHTTTIYDPTAGSGVQPGTSSASGDTILGPAGSNQLQITDTSGNGSAGTVSLDGGPPVAFTSADTNLEVTNNAGGVVYINTSAITPGFSGTVNITSNGTMSIDGGATSVPLTFTANQAVTNGSTGQITYVNTTNVQQTGSESIAYPGAYDAFQTLINLRNDLNNTSNLSQTAQLQAISNDVAELQRVQTNVLNTVGTQSTALQGMQSLQTHLQTLQLNAQTTAANVGDANMADLAVQLQSLQNMLQMSLETFSQIVSQNLLNYLK
jgi:flagellar hook-associated protein 3 FlgL